MNSGALYIQQIGPRRLRAEGTRFQICTPTKESLKRAIKCERDTVLILTHKMKLLRLISLLTTVAGYHSNYIYISDFRLLEIQFEFKVFSQCNYSASSDLSRPDLSPNPIYSQFFWS